MPSSSSQATLGDYRDQVVDDLMDLFDTSVKPQLISATKDQGANWLDDQYFNYSGLHFSTPDKNAIKDNLGSLADTIASAFRVKAGDALAPSNLTWNTPISAAPTGVQIDSPASATLSWGPITFQSGKTWTDYLSELVSGAFLNINSVNNLIPTFTYSSGKFLFQGGNVTDKFNSVLSSNSASTPESTWWGVWMSVKIGP